MEVYKYTLQVCLGKVGIKPLTQTKGNSVISGQIIIKGNKSCLHRFRRRTSLTANEAQSKRVGAGYDVTSYDATI